MFQSAHPSEDNSSQSLLQQALQFHQVGALEDAETLYHQLLSKEPQHPDALHLLGQLHHARGEASQALVWLGKALEANGEIPAFHNSLGTVLQSMGQSQAAFNCYQKAIQLNPNSVEAYNNLGLALQEAKRHPEALACFQTALRLEPEQAILWNNLGLSLQEVGQAGSARQAFETALRLDPACHPAAVNLGQVYHQEQRLLEARQILEQVQAQIPEDPATLNNLALVLADMGEVSAALALLQTAQSLAPQDLDTALNLGNLLQRAGRFEEAITVYKPWLAQHPGHGELARNLAMAYQGIQQFNSALQCLSEALEASPQDGELHLARAMAWLADGQFEAGWAEYEWRFETAQVPRRKFSQPTWEGDDLTGKTLLVTAEQGYGDAFQFVRFLPLLQQKGARVLMECHPGMGRIFATVAGADTVFERSPDGSVAQLFDCHVSLMSLPHCLNLGGETMAGRTPYLAVPEEIESKWAEVFSDVTGLKIGFVWAGSQTNGAGRFRSCPVEAFTPLFSTPESTWVCLQVGPEGADLLPCREKYPNLIILQDDLTDFAQTAAAITQLDLVITIDTAVAHLAGGMGKPVFLLLPAMADWRWGRHETTTQWYPTMRLFRQPRPGDWQAVMEAVQVELQTLQGVGICGYDRGIRSVTPSRHPFKP